MQNKIFEILKIEHQNILQLEEVKKFLRISNDNDDKLIQNLIYSSVEVAENFIGICLNKKYIKCIVNNSYETVINLHYKPIQTINKIFYENDNQEINLSNYKIKKDIGVLYLNIPLKINCELNILYESCFDQALIPYSIK